MPTDLDPFGWTVPEDTDPLKDGAAAIRELAADIAATMTTGATVVLRYAGGYQPPTSAWTTLNCGEIIRNQGFGIIAPSAGNQGVQLLADATLILTPQIVWDAGTVDVRMAVGKSGEETSPGSWFADGVSQVQNGARIATFASGDVIKIACYCRTTRLINSMILGATVLEAL